MLYDLFNLFHPMSIRFFADAGDTGGVATGGDKTDDGKTGDGKTGDDGKKSDDTKGQVYELVIDGVKRSVTVEEMRELAQKSAGADRKFEEAAKTRKEAEKGLRVLNLIDSLGNNPSESDAKELATLLGIDPTEFAEYLDKDEDDSAKGGKGSSKITKEDLVAGLMELGLNPDEVKNRLEYSHQRHVRDAKREIREISDSSVDKDEFFGKIKIGEKGEDRLNVIKDLVAEDVLRKIQDGEPYGADMVTASIQKVRSLITRFGIPGKPDQYPIVLGLGPGGGVPAEVNSEEPIKRISSAEDKDEKNLISRYLQKGIQAARLARKK
jgi:hypothetical protein